jgi:hypothetical protein
MKMVKSEIKRWPYLPVVFKFRLLLLLDLLKRSFFLLPFNRLSYLETQFLIKEIAEFACLSFKKAKNLFFVKPVALVEGLVVF